MAKVYVPTQGIAARYKTSTRNVPRMVSDGRIPPPTLYNGRHPLWDEEVLDENDRRAAMQSPPKLAARNSKSA